MMRCPHVLIYKRAFIASFLSDTGIAMLEALSGRARQTEFMYRIATFHMLGDQYFILALPSARCRHCN